MRVLFATAELTPIATVGGLAAASAGLTAELRRDGVDVDIVMPDYDGTALADEHRFELPMPDWAGRAIVRVGEHPVAGRLHLVHVDGIERPHPYTDARGEGWPDNDARFLRFSAAVAALVQRATPDVLHLNDWHTAAALVDLADPPPTVLSIHNLAYQGTTSPRWLAMLGRRALHYEWFGGFNPLAGGIALADVVVAVSPNYAASIVHPDHGMGLDRPLALRGDDLVGIVNGIDTTTWDPGTDPLIAVNYGSGPGTAVGAAKVANRAAVRAHFGFPDDDLPLASVVTRLTDQKGIDLLLPIVDVLHWMPVRLAVLGSGDADLAGRFAEAAGRHPEWVGFHQGYDEALSHQLFAGSDLFVMPSRFEPCGLTQMQAMRYGTAPVVTPTGGLLDTVVDADVDPDAGTGFIAEAIEPAAITATLFRAVRAVSSEARAAALRARMMGVDWSWRAPARRYLDVYRDVTARPSRRSTSIDPGWS